MNTTYFDQGRVSLTAENPYPVATRAYYQWQAGYDSQSEE